MLSILFKKSILLSFFISIMSSNVLAADDELHHSWLPVNIGVANKHIIPRYKAFAVSSNKLAKSITQLCVAEVPVSLTRKVKKQFKATYIDWAETQHIKFGPVSFLKRLERLQYWPDKHNASERQVRKLLFAIESNKDEALAGFDKKSVAVQGFTALERMLFSKDSVMSQAECQLAIAISANVSTIAEQLDSNWRLAPVEYAKEFELADRGAGTYSSNDEVIAILANAFATQLLVISEYKLGRGLPKKVGGRTFSRQMEAWRSGLSLSLAKASLKSVHSFYKTAFKQRLKKSNKALDKKIEKQFSIILKQFKKISEPMVSLIESEAGVAQIIELKTAVEKLESVVRTELFTELGFAARFNSLDGD